MKWLLFGWALPICFLGGWYGLSYYDMHFGIFMLTRDAHDLVFRIYGKVLGIPPADIPPLVFRAIIVDSILVLAIFAFRRRAKIMAWWRVRQASAQSSEPALAMDESLSSAP